MTLEIAIVLGLLVAAMILFTLEIWPIDVVALGLVCALIASGILTPAEAFSGFGSEVIIVLACIMILAGAIVKAGVMDWLGQLAHRAGRGNKRLSVLMLLAISATSSGVLSNTNTTAILMPAAIETARRAQISPSRVLMPLGFASMLGGAGTLIGTSANLAGSGMVERLGLAPFGLFEFIGVGVVMTVCGLLWLAFPGQATLPQGQAINADATDEPRRFFTTLFVPDGSGVAGKAIGDIDFDDLDTDLLAVLRGGERLDPHRARKLRAGDDLIARTTQDGLLKLKKSQDFMLEPDKHFGPEQGDKARQIMVEAVVTPQSRLVGKSLKQCAFFDRYRGVVVAVYRRHRGRPARLENLRLRQGDVLLVQGPKDDITALRSTTDLMVLSFVDRIVVTRREGLVTLGAMGVAIGLNVIGLMPLSLAFLLAVLFVVLAGNIAMAEAYRFIEWRLLVLIAAMSAFGRAMDQSGAANYLADHIVAWCLPFGPYAALTALSVLTVLLSQPMSNAAAALTVIPVAVAAADGLGLDPRMLAVLVTLSASLSFISPLEPACLLVYDAGRYRFLDYARAGTPLTIICVALLLIIVPWAWG